jgi:hypothetical protein
MHAGGRILPDGQVKGKDAPHGPLGGYPAPEARVAIHTMALAILDKDVHNGGDEGDAVAEEEVKGLDPSQAADVVLPVEDEVDVYWGPVSCWTLRKQSTCEQTHHPWPGTIIRLQA